MTHLTSGNSSVTIDQGELIGFQNNGHEFIHQKGSLGWRSADTEMFPIIGPVDKANFRVNVAKGEAIQDQHGLLRELDYDCFESTDTHVVFKKEYIAGTAVKNAKFPEKSTEQWLTWPYDFSFEKRFELIGEQLEITFDITGELQMPFMLGYHPAFKLHTENPVIVAGNREISLDEVLAVGSRALQVENCRSIVLRDARELTLTTHGFGHFMCWTEVPNMVCIEPITFYPYAVEQQNLHEGFQHLSDGKASFKAILKV